jgi:hypothetical protein
MGGKIVLLRARGFQKRTVTTNGGSYVPLF